MTSLLWNLVLSAFVEIVVLFCGLSLIKQLFASGL